MGYWLPVSDWNVNRFLVMVSAVALIVISALGLHAGGGTAHMIVNAVILAFAVLGLVGALTTDIRWMQLYLMMSDEHERLTLLFIWELIYILVSAIGYKRSFDTLTWDITLCIILAVSAVLTAGLIRRTGFAASGVY